MNSDRKSFRYQTEYSVFLNMDKQNTRKRCSTTAKNPEIKFQPTKFIKQDVKLDKLSKSKLVEKYLDLESALEQLTILKTKSDKEIERLKEEIKNLQTKNNQNTHMSSKNTQTYPNNDVDYNCGVCIFQTREEECLWSHMDNEHDIRKDTEENQIKCQMCDALYSNKTDLWYHVKHEHGKGKQSCKFFRKGECLFGSEEG